MRTLAQYGSLFLVLSAFFFSGCASTPEKKHSKKNQPVKAVQKKTAPAKPASATQKIQVTRVDSEAFKAANFDSDVIAFLQPGQSYLASTKRVGPFYLVRIKAGVVGYVADSDVQVEGKAPEEPKPYVNEVDPLSTSQEDIVPVFEDDEDDMKSSDFIDHKALNGIFVSLINYHENTMGGVQIGDLWALGYKRIPYYDDFSSTITWDVNMAFKAPDYYKKKTNANVNGFVTWGGAQIAGVNVLAPNRLLRYGVGPFAKYSHYSLKGNQDKYTLQDLSVGALLEGGVILKMSQISLDLGLRYYWDSESYGAMSVGILF